VKEWLAKTKTAHRKIRDFLEERGLESADHQKLSRFHRFALFCLLVAKSFSRNRCPVRASALAYTSLLALIPMLAVAVNVSSPFLKNDEDHLVSKWVDRIVDSLALTPANQPAVHPDLPEPEREGISPAETEPAALARKHLAETINGFIAKTNTSTVGLAGTALLIFAAISMLASIESTFNDIWGVSQGRTWFSRVVQYWAVITLGPVLLVLAAGLASGRHFSSTQAFLHHIPLLGTLLFRLLPVLILFLTFTVFYRVMPNTRVRWSAALVGGLVGGVLWHLNSIASVLYVSRWITNSRIYGGLAAIPVFMVSLYFSWLIVLFGAQVAYAFQNRDVYLQEKQADNVNQRGREFIALRLMECVGQRFFNALPASGIAEMAEALAVPTRLVQQIIEPLRAAGLVVEVRAEEESAYAPARPLECITCHDILLALRSGQGQELATRDDPARAGVFGEFERIVDAEERAASCVTIRAMVDRTGRLASPGGNGAEAVAEPKSED